jgi:hypothetical protein
MQTIINHDYPSTSEKLHITEHEAPAIFDDASNKLVEIRRKSIDKKNR